MSDARERVLRNTPGELLQGYFEQKGLDLKALAESDTRQRLFLFKRQSSQWNSSTLSKVLDDLERVDALASPECRVALIEASPNRETLLAQANEYGRAMWLFLQGESFFERAEDIAFAIEYRKHTRKWDAFVGPLHMTPNLLEEALHRMEAAISDYYHQHYGASPAVSVEIFPRLSALPESFDFRLIQATIYIEDLPQLSLEFWKKRLRQFNRRRARESAVVYCPATGILEVVGQDKIVRQALAEMFCQHILECDLSAATFKLRKFYLNNLKHQSEFPTDPEDGILSVKPTKVTLSTHDDSLKMRFTCSVKHPLNVHDLLEQHMGRASPLQNGTWVQSATLAVAFRYGKHPGRAQTINVDMTPHGCNLNDHDERHRLIMNKYLERWGLLETLQ